MFLSATPDSIRILVQLRPHIYLGSFLTLTSGKFRMFIRGLVIKSFQSLDRFYENSPDQSLAGKSKSATNKAGFETCGFQLLRLIDIAQIGEFLRSHDVAQTL